jgi:hypothetical protein
MQFALDIRLASLPGNVDIAWENIEYQAVTNVPHLRPTFFNVDGELICMSDGSQRNSGLYRVDAIYPVSQGPGALLTKLDAIYQHFKSSLVLTVGSTNVWIRAINVLSRTIIEGAWFMGSLDVNFVSYDGSEGTIMPPESAQWITTSTSLIPESGKRYITTNDVSRVVFTLPGTCPVGFYFRIAGYGLGGWRINCQAGMSIVYGDQETSVGGALESVNPHDCIELVCVVANTKFEELSSQGNITVI